MTDNTTILEEQRTKNALEMALLTSGQPLDRRALRHIAGATANDSIITAALDELRQDWNTRALRLIESANGFQFVSRLEYADYLRRLKPQRPPRMSNSLMEVLAIIAYQQPVTRGDIEQLRGVSVSSAQIAFLEEQEWIEEIGRRATPGRPVLYATTKIFLDDLGLSSLDDLPPLGGTESDNDGDATTEKPDSNPDDEPKNS